MATATESPGPNGSNGTSLAATRAATLAALNEMDAAADADKAPADEPAEKVEPDAEAEDAAEPDAADPGDEADESDEDEDADEGEEKAEDKEAKADPDLAKRLEQVKKAERRSRDALAAEREAFAQEKTNAIAQLQREWGPKIERAERIAGLEKRVT